MFKFYLKPLRLSLPVASAYVPLGMILGVLWVSHDIHPLWAIFASLIIFAGSIEFLVVTFITAGLPISSVAWVTLLVNFRHIFYGLSFPFSQLTSPAQKLYGIFALTDETYTLTHSGEGSTLTGKQITFLQLISHFWWVSGTACGALFGQLIPKHIHGFEFALTAMFITLYIDAAKHRKDFKLFIYAMISAFLGWVVETYVYPEAFLLSGLAIYITLLTFSYLKSSAKPQRDSQ